MKKFALPPIWIIVFIVGLSLFAETVYTPSLPEISRALHASESMVEHTLTIYLFGMAIGTLFFGNLSDRVGRKPCVLAGLLVFIIGCLGCYASDSIEMLMVFRFVQAFGGSVGSVLGQSITRDAFQGPDLGRVYSAVGSSLALFPAIGPIIGGNIAEHFKWYDIFLFLTVFALVLGFSVVKKLPETHDIKNRKSVSLIEVALTMLKDKKVIGLGLLVAASNGLGFCYYAEGPFYLINLLGLAPGEYGLTFIVVSFSAMLGGLYSVKLQKKHSSSSVLGYGLAIILFSSVLFASVTLWHRELGQISNTILIATTILVQMIMMFGRCIVTSNALALALVDYKWCIGTASSWFGFFYYCFISLFTFGMGMLHDGTLLPMPLYFFAIAVFMMVVKSVTIREK